MSNIFKVGKMRPEIDDSWSKIDILKRYFVLYFGEEYEKQISDALSQVNIVAVNPGGAYKSGSISPLDSSKSVFYKSLGYTFSDAELHELDLAFSNFSEQIAEGNLTNELAENYLTLSRFGENPNIKTVNDAKKYLKENFASVFAKFISNAREFENKFRLSSYDKKEVAMNAFESVFGKFNISKSSKFYAHLTNGSFAAFGKSRPLKSAYDRQTLDYLAQTLSGKNVSFEELEKDPQFASRLKAVQKIFDAKMSTLSSVRDEIIQRECPDFVSKTKHLNGAQIENMKGTIFDIYVNASLLSARCTRVVNDGAVESYLFLPSNIDNTTFVHEMLHQISTRFIFTPKDSYGKSELSENSKIGLRLYSIEGSDALDESKSLNEIVTDFLANEISIAMARNRENIFKMKEDPSSIYSYAFIEFGPVLRENMDLFKKLYICPAEEFSSIIDNKTYYEINDCANTLLGAIYERVRRYATLDTKEFRQLSSNIKSRLQGAFVNAGKPEAETTTPQVTTTERGL